MAFVVCEPCILCRYTDCVTVCPVNCFHEGANMLVIDPAECIDCGVCVDECPSAAIYPDDEVPEEWQHYISLNAHYAQEWPVIFKGKGPLPSADQYIDMEHKREHFRPEPGEGTPPGEIG